MTRLILAALSLTLLAVPARAQTCSCTKYQSAKQFAQFQDIIFKGKAISSKTQYGVTTTNFQVLETLKGEPEDAQPVTHPAPGKGCGGISFKPGQSVLILGQGESDNLGTTSCQLNAYSEAQIRAALK